MCYCILNSMNFNEPWMDNNGRNSYRHHQPRGFLSLSFARLALAVFFLSCNPKLAGGLRKKDFYKDVSILTSHGTMLIRLSDSTPLHRDNFLKLVKHHFYHGIVFHRVIQNFMIQAGDQKT